LRWKKNYLDALETPRPLRKTPHQPYPPIKGSAAMSAEALILRHVFATGPRLD